MVRTVNSLLTDAVEERPARPLDKTGFRAWVDATCGGEMLAILANREPASYSDTGPISARDESSGGLVTALAPLADCCKVLWVARGNADAPFMGMVNRHDVPRVPPANPHLRLSRVSLTKQEREGYYNGFSNEGLWPLCHRTTVRPIFREVDFRMYSTVNARWVDALCQEVTIDSPIVLVQDYHFALAPRMIHERLPLAIAVTFWHIPFPSPAKLAACPWERDLIDGLLGSSVLGFQTSNDCHNFLDAAVCVLGAHVDRDAQVVSHRGKQTLVRAYPVSVEWPSQCVLRSPAVGTCRAMLGRRFDLAPETRLILGIDRLDYTKGLIQKVFAFERLLTTRPELRGKAVLLQIAEPSRSSLPAYQGYRARLSQTVNRINRRFATKGYEPIVLLERRFGKNEVFELFRACDVCYVGSLQDGMNLVSKEFVSARDDERGVLVLSEFAGAACELEDALHINPYDIDDCANTLARALNMSADEQTVRMQRLRTVVMHNNSYKWARDILADAISVRKALVHGIAAAAL
jgi:trehalose 6-phosphate synthase